ncbi:MAG: glycosyl hydrolase [Niabella sp.]
MIKIYLLGCITMLCNTMLAQIAPSDKYATPETRRLFANLQKISTKGYLVGHQDDLAYGVTWKYEPGMSDVKEVTGDYPGIYGWELGNLELGRDKNLDGVPFDKMRQYIIGAYQRGAVITISWHVNNPFTGKNAWDPAPGSVAAVLPGGSRHEVYKEYLDKVAAFLHELKGQKGEAVPILWRPFHEHTGGWFWWGANSSTNEEYKQLFRFSVDYLRNEKHLHNLLIGYNTGTEFASEAQFLERYPGDDYVDILSFDAYQRGEAKYDPVFVKMLDAGLEIITSIAKKRNKIAAVGETGFNRILYSKWFTQALTPVLKKHRFAYILFWRNAGYKPYDQTTEFYVPYKGHASAADFKTFYKLRETLFEKEVRKENLYGPAKQ